MADQIAQISHSLYDSLPNKAKPLIRNNGIPEWTILASIILSVTTNVDDDGGGGGRGDASIKTSSNIETGTGQMTLTTTTTATTYIPISLGTGVKCLPANRLPPLGDALHDSHAEILARRGFVRWLLTEAGTVIDGEDDGLGVLRFDHQDGMFRLREDVGVWLYVSALPCGDASTLHTAAHQPPAMAKIKSTSTLPRPTADQTEGTTIRGRNGYEAFGKLRTKPGRADSQPSISLSCSDKIASWCVTGLNGGLLSSPVERLHEPSSLSSKIDLDLKVDGMFQPIYLTGMVVGGVEEWPPQSEFFDKLEISPGGWRERVRMECERAFWSRLSGLKDRLPSPYKLQRPVIYLTEIPFKYSKPVVSASSKTPLNPDSASTLASGQSPVPAVTSTLYLPFPLPPTPALATNTDDHGHNHDPDHDLKVPGSFKNKSSSYPQSTTEILSNGTTQSGSWKSPGESLVKEKARSKVCKHELMRSYLNLRKKVSSLYPSFAIPSPETTYYELKHHPKSRYQSAKVILRGLPDEDDLEVERSMDRDRDKDRDEEQERKQTVPQGFALDFARTVAAVVDKDGGDTPFRGWIVSGKRYESFTV